jgi:predicted amidohydrolase
MFKKGVEILLVPSKITTEGLKIWRDYIKIRALENRIAIVNANALAPPDYIGNSFAITPVKKGGIVDTLTVAELGEEENYTIADIDPLTYFHLRLERLKEISDTSVDEI